MSTVNLKLLFLLCQFQGDDFIRHTNQQWSILIPHQYRSFIPRTSHPFSFLLPLSHPLAHPELSPSYSRAHTNLWHFPFQIRRRIMPSKLFHTPWVPLRDQEPFCTSFLMPSLECTASRGGLCKRQLPLPQLWLTSESSSTCIRWFHMGSVCSGGR